MYHARDRIENQAFTHVKQVKQQPSPLVMHVMHGGGGGGAMHGPKRKLPRYVPALENPDRRAKSLSPPPFTPFTEDGGPQPLPMGKPWTSGSPAIATQAEEKALLQQMILAQREQKQQQQALRIAAERELFEERRLKHQEDAKRRHAESEVELQRQALQDQIVALENSVVKQNSRVKARFSGTSTPEPKDASAASPHSLAAMLLELEQRLVSQKAEQDAAAVARGIVDTIHSEDEHRVQLEECESAELQTLASEWELRIQVETEESGERQSMARAHTLEAFLYSELQQRAPLMMIENVQRTILRNELLTNVFAIAFEDTIARHDAARSRIETAEAEDFESLVELYDRKIAQANQKGLLRRLEQERLEAEFMEACAWMNDWESTVRQRVTHDLMWGRVTELIATLVPFEAGLRSGLLTEEARQHSGIVETKANLEASVDFDRFVKASMYHYLKRITTIQRFFRRCLAWKASQRLVARNEIMETEEMLRWEWAEQEENEREHLEEKVMRQFFAVQWPARQRWTPLDSAATFVTPTTKPRDRSVHFLTPRTAERQAQAAATNPVQSSPSAYFFNGSPTKSPSTSRSLFSPSQSPALPTQGVLGQSPSPHRQPQLQTFSPISTQSPAPLPYAIPIGGSTPTYTQQRGLNAPMVTQFQAPYANQPSPTRTQPDHHLSEGLVLNHPRISPPPIPDPPSAETSVTDTALLIRVSDPPGSVVPHRRPEVEDHDQPASGVALMGGEAELFAVLLTQEETGRAFLLDVENSEGATLYAGIARLMKADWWQLALLAPPEPLPEDGPVQLRPDFASPLPEQEPLSQSQTVVGTQTDVEAPEAPPHAVNTTVTTEPPPLQPEAKHIQLQPDPDHVLPLLPKNDPNPPSEPEPQPDAFQASWTQGSERSLTSSEEGPVYFLTSDPQIAVLREDDNRLLLEEEARREYEALMEEWEELTEDQTGDSSMDLQIHLDVLKLQVEEEDARAQIESICYQVPWHM